MQTGQVNLNQIFVSERGWQCNCIVNVMQMYESTYRMHNAVIIKKVQLAFEDDVYEKNNLL